MASASNQRESCGQPHLKRKRQQRHVLKSADATVCVCVYSLQLQLQLSERGSLLSRVWKVDFERFLADRCCSLGARQEPKTPIYNVFVPLAWKKYFLQHAENCVKTCKDQCFCQALIKIIKTVIFATRGQKKSKYCGFGLPRRQRHRYLRFYYAPSVPEKNMKTPSYTIPI